MSDKPKQPPLSSLDWLPYDPDKDWNDGERILTAVLVRSSETGKEEWRYYVVTITIILDDEDEWIDTVPEVDGNLWGWDLEDIDWYVEI